MEANEVVKPAEVQEYDGEDGALVAKFYAPEDGRQGCVALSSQVMNQNESHWLTLRIRSAIRREVMGPSLAGQVLQQQTAAAMERQRKAEAEGRTWPPEPIAQWEHGTDEENVHLSAYADDASERQGGRFYLHGQSETKENDGALFLTEDEARFVVASLTEALERRPWEQS